MSSHRGTYTFQATVKRFFAPFRVHTKDAVLSILQVSTRPFYGIMTTLLVSKAMGHIQIPDKHAFMMTLIWFVVGIILYQIWNAVMRMSFITYTWKAYSTLLREYFIKFVQLDNNVAERTGTGKMLSIMEKGVDVSVDLQVQTMSL